MFNGTNLTLNSDLALVSTQVKTPLGKKQGNMSTCTGVRHTPGHWKIKKTLALLLLIRGCSACVDPAEGGGGGGGRGAGGPDPPLKITKR